MVGDIPVLAIDAATGASGKEDRTSAAGTGDRRLFPQMRGRAGDEQLITEAAETGPDGAVSLALPRAEGATGKFRIHNSQFIIRECRLRAEKVN